MARDTGHSLLDDAKHFLWNVVLGLSIRFVAGHAGVAVWLTARSAPR